MTNETVVSLKMSWYNEKLNEFWSHRYEVFLSKLSRITEFLIAIKIRYTSVVLFNGSAKIYQNKEHKFKKKKNVFNDNQPNQPTCVHFIKNENLSDITVLC